jgi:hypothetical protein
MFSATSVFAEVGHRERDVRIAAERAEHDRIALRRAAHQFAARLAYGFGQPTGLAACFAAGCAVGARRAGAGALIASAWRISRLIGARVVKRGIATQKLERQADLFAARSARKPDRPVGLTA